MNPTLTDLINQFGLLAAILISIGNFFYTNANLKKKQNLEVTDTTVKNTKEIQEIYETSFKTFEARYKKEIEEKEKEHAEDLNNLRRSIEDQERQKQGELMVKIKDLEERNTDLKVQVAQLGGIVQGVTGVRIYEWAPKKEVPES